MGLSSLSNRFLQRLKFWSHQRPEPSSHLARLRNHQDRCGQVSWSGRHLKQIHYQSILEKWSFLYIRRQCINTWRDPFLLESGYLRWRLSYWPRQFIPLSVRDLLLQFPQEHETHSRFYNASWCVSNDNKRNNTDICATYFFSCTTIEYSLVLRILINSVVSTSLTLFFLCGSSASASFLFSFSFFSLC